jgi:hypothetical protein
LKIQAGLFHHLAEVNGVDRNWTVYGRLGHAVRLERKLGGRQGARALFIGLGNAYAAYAAYEKRGPSSPTLRPSVVNEELTKDGVCHTGHPRDGLSSIKSQQRTLSNRSQAHVTGHPRTIKILKETKTTRHTCRDSMHGARGDSKQREEGTNGERSQAMSKARRQRPQATEEANRAQVGQKHQFESEAHSNEAKTRGRSMAHDQDGRTSWQEPQRRRRTDQREPAGRHPTPEMRHTMSSGRRPMRRPPVS